MFLSAINWATVGIKAAQLILSLSILVLLHEFGHFIAAKSFKCRVEKFYLFFDAWFSIIAFKKINNKWRVKLFRRNLPETETFMENGEKKTKLIDTTPLPDGDWRKYPDHTQYGIGWIPFGGYCRVAGMIDESMAIEQMKQAPQPYEYRSKPAWQRLIIMLGGIIMNVILGFIIYIGMFWHWGDSYIPAQKLPYGIYADSLARSIGLQNGDIITAIDGKPTVKFEDIPADIIINNPAAIQVLRGGNIVNINIPKDLTSQVINKHLHFLGLNDILTPMQPIDTVLDTSAAKKAGFLKNDLVLSADGHPMKFWNEFSHSIKSNAGKTLAVQVLRNGKDTMQLSVAVPESGVIGVSFITKNIVPTDTFHYSFLQAIPAGIAHGWNTIVSYVKQLKVLFSGKINMSEGLSGPVGIANIFPAIWNWQAFWTLTALLSMVLAVMNLLPIPALDGGHVVFCLFEMITGNKPSDKFMERAQMVGMILLFAIMIFAFGNDIFKLFK